MHFFCNQNENLGPRNQIKLSSLCLYNCNVGTSKSLSEALIFASTNPQYDDILFIELQVRYVKIPSSEHGEIMLCTEIDFDIQNNLYTQPRVVQK